MVQFMERQRDEYTGATDRGYVGTLRRVSDHRFAFIDARHLRPSGAELIPVYADELLEIVEKIKQLEAVVRQ